MDKLEIKSKLLDIIRRVIDDVSMDEHTRIDEIALDSLRFIKVVVQIEKTFQIKFDDEYLLLHKYEQIGDICDYIESKTA